MRLTEKLEPYKFQLFIQTACITQKFEQKTEINKVLILPLIASRLSERAFRVRRSITPPVQKLFRPI